MAATEQRFGGWPLPTTGGQQNNVIVMPDQTCLLQSYQKANQISELQSKSKYEIWFDH
jgi:hypothetical protein